jgi:acyl-CoA synthetase (AMP-forming)/AMP-acid ligase II
MSGASLETERAPSGHFLDDLKATIATQANKVAVCFQDHSLSYGDLDRGARAWALLLREAGVEPGDRVAIITPEKRSFLTAHLGTLYAGAISLPLNPRFTREELRFFLGDSDARGVVAGKGQYSVVESLQSELPELRGLLSDVQPLRAHQSAFAEPAIGSDTPCLMLYSSGTTGRPKGVVHTHANLSSSLRAL